MKSFPYKKEIKEGIDQINSKQCKIVEIKSFDKTKLAGYLYTTEDAKSTIILVHGYGSNGFQDFGTVFDFYRSFGFNILIICQRAHGKSKGHFCTFGIKESKDILCWANYVHSLFNLPVRISGISLGSSSSLFTLSQNPKNIISIVADCGFTSPYEEIANTSRSKFHLPAFLFIGLVGLYARLFLHINIKQSAIDSVRVSTIPIIFIHGRADDFVPFWMGEKLYNNCSSKKVSLFIEGAGHGLSYFTQPEFVKKGIKSFFISMTDID